MLNNGLLTSETVEWSTPTEIVSQLEWEFGAFTLDPCATINNAKAPKFFTQDDNGLVQSWSGERVFMNPPYGRTISDWTSKAYEESKRGSLVVCLVPSRTDTDWWHRFAMKGEIRFIRGRIQFGSLGVNAPFPSALIIFHPNTST